MSDSLCRLVLVLEYQLIITKVDEDIPALL
jgi:hypothetical protein